tara:strand:- start:1221 stop:1994 length:774 start_codon:yes stop_codon:yes gene_type:complete
MKKIVVIPARLNSKRFPNKILLDLKGLPMIEHVRRRALLAENVKEVYIATCDTEIRDVSESYGAKVIMTSKNHKNGTTRVAEAVSCINCSNVILIQGDEPLLLPRHLDKMTNVISLDNNSFAWNATGPIETEDEFNRNSIVKASIYENKILYCFRKNNLVNNFGANGHNFRKILGLIAYKKDFLISLIEMNPTVVEKMESIEQMRIIENGYSICSVPFESSQPSINEPSEVQLVWDYVANNKEQKTILEKVFNFNYK